MLLKRPKRLRQTSPEILQAGRLISELNRFRISSFTMCRMASDIMRTLLAIRFFRIQGEVTIGWERTMARGQFLSTCCKTRTFLP